MDSGIDEYIETRKSAPDVVRKACFHLMYSQDTELRHRWAEFLKDNKLQRLREDSMGNRYAELKRQAEHKHMPLTIFRNYDIIDHLTDKRYSVLLVGMQDYDQDKEVYKDSLIIATNRHPLLYAYVMKDCKNKQIIPMSKKE